MAVVEKTKVYILEYPANHNGKNEKYEILFELFEHSRMVEVRYRIDGRERDCSLSMHDGTLYTIPKFYTVETARVIWKELVRWNYFHSNP